MDLMVEIESTDAEGMEAIRDLAQETATVLEGPSGRCTIAWSGHHEERGMFESFATILGQIHIDPGLLEHGRTFAAEVAAAVPAEILANFIVERIGHRKAAKPAPENKADTPATTMLRLKTGDGKDMTVEVSCRDPVELKVTLSKAITVHVKRG